MKVRIYRNSIRLRLSRTELAQFLDTGRVEERLEFGPDLVDMFRCALVREPAAAAVTARYLPGVIEIAVPSTVADEWGRSEEPGVEGSYSGGERPIAILIEKDFECLHHPGDAEADAFPNPAAAR